MRPWRPDRPLDLWRFLLLIFRNLCRCRFIDFRFTDRFGNFLFDQIQRRRPVRRFANGIEQFMFVIRVNRQGFFEAAGGNVELLAVGGAERLGTFGHKHAVHALALRTVGREAIAMRQVAVILCQPRRGWKASHGFAWQRRIGPASC